MQAIIFGHGVRSLLVLVLGGIVLSACDENSTAKGDRCISSLGVDFVRAFSQDVNEAPLDASELDLALTPRSEPFNVPC